MVEQSTGIQDREPRPLRPANEWAAMKVLLTCEPDNAAKAVLDRAKVITCRTCEGFGHSQKKCPTELKFRNAKLADPLVRSICSHFNQF